MASPIGTKVRLFDGQEGTIQGFHFGAPDSQYGMAFASGHPVFDIKLSTGAVLKNVPLSVLSTIT